MKHIESLLIAVATAASAALIAFATGPATSTAADYVVTPAAASTAQLPSGGNLVLQDTTAAHGTTMTCAGVAARSIPTAGAHPFLPAPTAGTTTHPTDVAATVTPTARSRSNCTSRFGPMQLSPSGTWSLWLDSTSATGGHGYLGGIRAHVSAGSGTCSFDVSGYLAGTYRNATGQLTTDPRVSGLQLSKVTGAGCTPLSLANGHLATLTGSIQLSPSATIS